MGPALSSLARKSTKHARACRPRNEWPGEKLAHPNCGNLRPPRPPSITKVREASARGWLNQKQRPALRNVFAPSRIYLSSGTRHVAIRAEDAAIVVYGLQHPPTTLTLIKVLARVLGHTFFFAMPAPWTHDRGDKLNHDWPRIGKKEEEPQAAASILPRYSRPRAERFKATSESLTCSLPVRGLFTTATNPPPPRLRVFGSAPRQRQWT